MITKLDLIDAIRRGRADSITVNEASNIAGDIVRAIGDELATLGGSVILNGFGRLATVPAAARGGNNPRTGEKIAVPAGHRIRFKPSADMKRRLADLPVAFAAAP